VSCLGIVSAVAPLFNSVARPRALQAQPESICAYTTVSVRPSVSAFLACEQKRRPHFVVAAGWGARAGGGGALFSVNGTNE
jgi:hypothetical protein